MHAEPAVIKGRGARSTRYMYFYETQSTGTTRYSTLPGAGWLTARLRASNYQSATQGGDGSP